MNKDRIGSILGSKQYYSLNKNQINLKETL
jgi:hypothetical protein